MIKILYSLLMMIVCTTTGCVTDDEPDGPSLIAGDPLPEFSVTMNNGEVISTNSLKGTIPVIVFFNTGCSDCQKELPVIQKLWEEYNNTQGVKIVAIAREEKADEIRNYWKKNGLSLPYSPQDTREVYNLFATSIIPRIYIANRDGIITSTFDDSKMPGYDLLVSKIKEAQNLGTVSKFEK